MLVAVMWLAGCTNASHRQVNAETIAQTAKLQRDDIPAGMFTLRTYARISKTNMPATIYLEGDGFAWADKHTPALDPTPVDPLALRLATLDPSANVVYISRPCQYIPHQTACGVKYWTSARLSPKVVDSVDAVLEHLRMRGIPAFHLVGYSGGGGLAMLIAAKRKDIIDIRTVAGNLDTDRFTEFHHTTAMSESLNPMMTARANAHLAQLHFTGAQDNVVPANIAQGFYAASGYSNCVHVMHVENASHASGWFEHWPEMLTRPVTCGSKH